MRKNKTVMVLGHPMTAAQVARHLDMPYHTVIRRINAGRTFAQIQAEAHRRGSSGI
jgi:hypothetical protein